MKTIFKLVFLVLMPLICIQCEESTPFQVMEETTPNNPFKLSDHNLDELINNGYNSDMVLLDQNSFILAKSLLSLYEENDYNSFIKKTYDEYQINSIPFSILFKDEVFERSFNSKLSAILMNPTLKGTSSVSSSQELYSTFKIGSNDQEPTVHLINPRTADFSLPPIISPAIEVEDDSSQGINDCIVAWFEDDAGEIHQITIGEEEALNSKWPVLVLSSIDKKDETNIVAGVFKNEHLNLVDSRQNFQKGTAAIDRFCSCEYRLNERFENTGNCEFCVITYSVYDNGTGYVTENLYDDNNDHSKKIADVSFDDIGEDLTHWEFFCDNLTPYSDYDVFYNTFERDWYSSLKRIGEIQYPYYSQSTLYIAARMKSSDNWYVNDPATYSFNDGVDLADIESSWAEFYESDNGHFKIWRVD